MKRRKFEIRVHITQVVQNHRRQGGVLPSQRRQTIVHRERAKLIQIPLRKK